jgi:hypothetical protein
MFRRFACLMALCAAAAGVTLSYTAAACRAQMVRISTDGGVYVRAPFVRVYVDSYGGTSVRAPFAAVDVPGRGHPNEHSPEVIEQRVWQRSVPTAEDLRVMDEEALWQHLSLTANRLHERLGRFDTGASWQRYLRLREEVLADSSLDSHDVRAVTELLRRFRYVATEPRYEMIADLATFTEMQAALTEAVSRLDASRTSGEESDEELPTPLPKPSRP